jgi:hypothetical protein
MLKRFLDAHHVLKITRRNYKMRSCNLGGRKTWKQKHHSEGIGQLHKGDLTSKGYSLSKGKTARRSALKKVVKIEGPLKAFRQLNAVAVYTKKTAPSKSKTFKADRNWVRKTYMKTK